VQNGRVFLGLLARVLVVLEEAVGELVEKAAATARHQLLGEVELQGMI
jgi:hypothetical protein